MIEQGTRFNYFTVVTSTVNAGNRNWIEVRCDCGEACLRRLDHLTSGRTKSCKRCSAKRKSVHYPPPVVSQYCGDLGRTLFSTYRYGAEKRSLSFNVTQEYVWDLLIKQNFKCALSGIQIHLSTKIKDHAPDYETFTASLDRIDSSKGYEVGNLQWVHRVINRLKNNMSDEDFIMWCSLVCNHANQQPSAGNEMQDVPAKVQRLGGEDTQTDNPPKSVRHNECFICGKDHGGLSCPDMIVT